MILKYLLPILLLLNSYFAEGKIITFLNSYSWAIHKCDTFII